MSPEEFEIQIKKLDINIKKLIVEKFTGMRGEWEKVSTEELIPFIYKNLGWPVEEMNFSDADFGKKYTLVRSIYTILQMKKGFFGKPYLACYKCDAKMLEEGRNYICKKCDVISDADPFLIEPTNVEVVKVGKHSIKFRKN